MRGTVAAGDGIVFRTTKPSVADVDGNVRSFYSRKGFYGHALQAFCDGNCKFVHISQKVCASTHDGTAYVVLGMSNIIEQGKLPTWAHIVLEGKTCRLKRTLSTTTCLCTVKLLKEHLAFF